MGSGRFEQSQEAFGMKLQVSAPGRICLFGEHQDYFQLPVAASAIDLRCRLRGHSRSDRRVELHLLDLDEVHTWDLDALPQPQPRNYWLAGLHVAKKEGWLPATGWTCKVTSTIPQQAGASSSSALTVAWCALIASLSRQAWNPSWVAQAAWRTEVEFFNEPGGMMDHAVCASGGVQRIQFAPDFRCDELPLPSGDWLLIDSAEPKDTLVILQRAKHRRMHLLQEWGADLHAGNEPPRPAHWSSDDHALMNATGGIRVVSERGTRLLEASAHELDLGQCLTVHHRWLSEGLKVSTPRIDELLEQAMQLGACGGKINGSGGGGTAFAVFPRGQRAQAVEAFRAQGVTVHPIALGEEGVRIDSFAEDC